jgi:hypothetical protein
MKALFVRQDRQQVGAAWSVDAAPVARRLQRSA